MAANAPDVDVLSFVKGEYFALAFRRGITHGWPALLVLPFLVTAAVLAWDRWVRRKRDRRADPARAGPVLALATGGLLTHPALDWLNTYGMRWGVPFDDGWTYGDALFIIDPWIWLVLGGAVLLAYRPGRRVLIAGSSLGAVTTLIVIAGVGFPIASLWLIGIALVGWLLPRRRSLDRTRRGGVRGAMAVVATYVLVLVALGPSASRQVRAPAESAGVDVEDIMVAPLPANPLASDVWIFTGDEYVPGSYGWLASPRVALDLERAIPLLALPDDLPLARSEEILAAARARPAARDYLVWSRYPYVRVTSEGDGWLVRFGDARYAGRPGVGGLAGVTTQIENTEIR